MDKLTTVRKTAKVINQLFGNNHIQVTIGGDRAFSNGGRINIPMIDFTDPASVIMTEGYIDHECGHESDSDHSFMDVIKPLHGKMGKSVLNALEDARMEKCRSTLYPGARINLQNTWDLAISEGLVPNPNSIQSLPGLLFSFILNYVRSVVNEYDTYALDAEKLLLDTFKSQFILTLKSYIDQTLNAQSTSDCFDIACKIMEYLKEEDQNQNDDSPSDDNDESESDDNDESESNDNDESESDDNDESESDDNDESESNDNDESESNDNDESESDDNDESESDDNDESESNDNDESESDDNDESESDDNDESESDDNDESESDDNDESESDDNDESESDDNDESESDDNDESESDDNDESELDENASIPFYELDEEQDYHERIQEELNKLSENYDVVDEALDLDFQFDDDNIQRIGQPTNWEHLSGQFTRTLQRVLIDNSEHLKFPSVNGRQLMGSKLASIACGNDVVFEQKEEYDAPTSSVYLLIDASGSMDGSPMVEANKTALAFAKSFQKLQIDVEVTYFGARTSYESPDFLYTAKKYGRKLDTSLFNVEAFGSTPTDVGLMYALMRVINHSSDNKIIFLVTDGQPNCTNKVISAVSLIELAGIKIVPIGLGTTEVKGFKNPVFAENSEAVNAALKDAIKKKLFA